MGFINITLIDVIDILVVAMIMFQIYRLTRGTNALRIVIGILIVYLTDHRCGSNRVDCGVSTGDTSIFGFVGYPIFPS